MKDLSHSTLPWKAWWNEDGSAAGVDCRVGDDPRGAGVCEILIENIALDNDAEAFTLAKNDALLIERAVNSYDALVAACAAVASFDACEEAANWKDAKGKLVRACREALKKAGLCAYYGGEPGYGPCLLPKGHEGPHMDQSDKDDGEF